MAYAVARGWRLVETGPRAHAWGGCTAQPKRRDAKPERSRRASGTLDETTKPGTVEQGNSRPGVVRVQSCPDSLRS